ncbi:GNAT family N-acetyltransferase [Oscillospiraceae bacterium PP1C4]
MTIRQLQHHEIQSALDLVWTVFTKFEAPDYSEKGVNTFRQFINDKTMTNRLLIYGAFICDKLVGVLAIRDESHISLFFVQKEYHQQGIGRNLFEYAVQNCKSDKMTVNSSPYAVEIYHKLGFADTNTEQTMDGIRFTPMVVYIH